MRDAGELGQAEGEVEVLQRLGRRALEQVVLGGDHDEPPAIVRQRETTDLDVVATEDNLLKGAATQALQNLNLAFGLPELTGIPH